MLWIRLGDPLLLKNLTYIRKKIWSHSGLPIGNQNTVAKILKREGVMWWDVGEGRHYRPSCVGRRRWLQVLEHDEDIHTAAR